MDSAGRPREPKHIDLWRLPEVLELQVRRRRFDPKFRVTTAGVDRYESEAIEVEIKVSEPFTVRALGPVLWIGDEPLTIAESDGEVTYRFFAFRPEALRKDAPISLSWNSPGSLKHETKFRFAMPAD
jgi:hypothetical protein